MNAGRWSSTETYSPGTHALLCGLHITTWTAPLCWSSAHGYGCTLALKHFFVVKRFPMCGEPSTRKLKHFRRNSLRKLWDTPFPQFFVPFIVCTNRRVRVLELTVPGPHPHCTVSIVPPNTQPCCCLVYCLDGKINVCCWLLLHWEGITLTTTSFYCKQSVAVYCLTGYNRGFSHRRCKAIVAAL